MPYIATPYFSGDYQDLDGKPSIPVSTGDLINNIGFVTESSLSGYSTSGDLVGFVTTGALTGYSTSGDLVGFVTTGALTGYSTSGDLVGFVTTGALTGYATEGYVDSNISNKISEDLAIAYSIAL